MMTITLDDLHDRQNFIEHCEVLLMLLKMKKNKGKNSPAINHHIRSAVREASKHVTPYKNRRTPYISERVRSVKSNKALVKEHVIPIKILTSIIHKMESPTLESIQKFLLEHSILATITKDENKKLKKAGLNESMPDGTAILGNFDKFARYKKVKITWCLNHSAGEWGEALKQSGIKQNAPSALC